MQTDEAISALIATGYTWHHSYFQSLDGDPEFDTQPKEAHHQVSIILSYDDGAEGWGGDVMENIDRIDRKLFGPMGLFRDACQLLWGANWQTPAAKALGVSLRLVQYWSSGERNFQPQHAKALADLLDKRRAELAFDRNELLRLVARSERAVFERQDRAKRLKAARQKVRRRMLAAMKHAEGATQNVAAD